MKFQLSRGIQNKVYKIRVKKSKTWSFRDAFVADDDEHARRKFKTYIEEYTEKQKWNSNEVLDEVEV